MDVPGLGDVVNDVDLTGVDVTVGVDSSRTCTCTFDVEGFSSLFVKSTLLLFCDAKYCANLDGPVVVVVLLSILALLVERVPDAFNNARASSIVACFSLARDSASWEAFNAKRSLIDKLDRSTGAEVAEAAAAGDTEDGPVPLYLVGKLKLIQ